MNGTFAIPIRAAAQELGVSTATLRRWEREGLLPFTPKRDAVGRRVFTFTQVEELRGVLVTRHQARMACES